MYVRPFNSLNRGIEADPVGSFAHSYNDLLASGLQDE